MGLFAVNVRIELGVVSGPCNSFYCLGLSKNVKMSMMMMMMMMMMMGDWEMRYSTQTAADVSR